MEHFDKFFTDDVVKQWDLERNDNEDRVTVVNIDGVEYRVNRKTVTQVFADGADGSRVARAVTVTELHDSHEVIIMPGDPLFHVAKIKSANILYGQDQAPVNPAEGG